jgi:hypothetical protein
MSLDFIWRILTICVRFGEYSFFISVGEYIKEKLTDSTLSRLQRELSKISLLLISLT